MRAGVVCKFTVHFSTLFCTTSYVALQAQCFSSFRRTGSFFSPPESRAMSPTRINRVIGHHAGDPGFAPHAVR